MRFFCLIIGIIALSPISRGQNIDSLSTAYSNTNDPSQKTQILLDIGQLVEKQSLDSSLHYFNEALLHAEQAKTDTLIAKCYAHIGDAYLLKGSFETSLDYHLKAREIYKNHPKQLNYTKVINSLGLIYFYQENYEKALEYFNSITVSLDEHYPEESENGNRTRGRIYNNIGIIYDNTNRFDQALEYYAQAATYSKKVDDLQTLPSIYSNMGIIYLKTERYQLAESIFMEAFQIRESQNDNYGLCKSYYHLASVYNATGRYNLAEQNLLEGIKYCDLARSMPGKTTILRELAITLEKKGDFESAYQHHVQFKALSDSLFSLEAQEKMTQAEMQFNYEKEQQQQVAQQSKKELTYIIIGIILIFGVITAVAMYFLQKTKAKNELLAKEKAEFEKENIEMTNKELSLRKQNLEYELEFKNKELTTNVMYLLKKNELINEISDRLVELKKAMKKDNQKIIQRIIIDLQTARDHDVWEEFEVRFNQVYNDFYERLHQKFPNLTPSERKICAFLRLNMTTKEICALTRQSYNSLNVARARLRKKLRLDNTETNLVAYLEAI